MNTQTGMHKNWYVSVGTAAVLAATIGMGAAMAGTLDSTWKEATLPQVKALLQKDTGKVSGDTVTYSGKTVHVVAAAVLPGFPFPSFEVHDKKILP
jgi:rusticyanin